MIISNLPVWVMDSLVSRGTTSSGGSDYAFIGQILHKAMKE